MLIRVVMPMLMISTMILTGCDFSAKSAMQSTQSLYREYLNPPAQVDYEDTGSLEKAEANLAIQMKTIDEELTMLERRLSNADRSPTAQSVQRLFNEFPWLSGFAAIDATSGAILAQEPPVPLKPIDFAPLLEQKPREESGRGIRALIQETPLGPEIILGVPVYNGPEIQGIVVVHFDLYALMARSHSSSEMMVLSPEKVLWSGRFTEGSTPLAGQNWDALTEDDVTGLVSNESGEFLWVSRYLGDIPLVFAVPVVERDIVAYDTASEAVVEETEEPIEESDSDTSYTADEPAELEEQAEDTSSTSSEESDHGDASWLLGPSGNAPN